MLTLKLHLLLKEKKMLYLSIVTSNYKIGVLDNLPKKSQTTFVFASKLFKSYLNIFVLLDPYVLNIS